MFDGTDSGDEEILECDTGPILIVRRICLTLRANGDEWLDNNIFQSTCTIQGKVYRFVIDVGSFESIVSMEAIQKLGVKIEAQTIQTCMVEKGWRGNNFSTCLGFLFYWFEV